MTLPMTLAEVIERIQELIRNTEKYHRMLVEQSASFTFRAQERDWPNIGHASARLLALHECLALLERMEDS